MSSVTRRMRLTAWARLIKRRRIRLGLDQSPFAKEVGVRTNAVSAWETESSEPKDSNQEALAKVFGISAERLNQLHQQEIMQLRLDELEVSEKGSPDYDDPSITTLCLTLFLELEDDEEFKKTKREQPLIGDSANRCRAHVDAFVSEWRKLRSSLSPHQEGNS